MTPSWYDVLGVDDDASPDDIRAAWQDSIAGLAPGDRRFKQRNRAAEVLLDPARRAAHDADLAADLAADEADEVDETGDDHEHHDRDDAPGATAGTAVRTEPARPVASTASATSGAPILVKQRVAPAGGDPDDRTDRAAPAERSAADGATDGRRRTGPSPALVVAAVVLALALLVATVLALVLGGESGDAASRLPDDREITAARTAAETAIGPVLSYDYRELEESRAAAVSLMTPAYAEEYERNFDAVIATNAERTKTIVTARVVTSGVVRTGEDIVDVLVFVNRPTRNASKDVVSRDQVTVRMRDVDDRWLVDCLLIEAGDVCGGE